MTMGRHARQRLYLAEDLLRRRRADESRRHVASQRVARIDPNPHQIDAVVGCPYIAYLQSRYFQEGKVVRAP